MNPSLSPEQEEIRELVRVLVRRKIAPRAENHDRTGAFPSENFADLAEAELLGLLIPIEQGGLGADMVTYALVIEELARGCGSTALIFAMHCGATHAIASGGTAEQKERYLRPVVADGKLFAWGFSEPGTGGNILRPQLRACQQDGAFVLNGRKSFCTGAGHVDYYLINGQAENAADFAQSQHLFVIEPQAVGLSVNESWDSLGMRANCSNDLVIDGIRLCAHACIGGPGAGVQILSRSIAPLILGLAATSLGVGVAAYEFARDHVSQRFVAPTNRPLAAFQAVRMMVADMAIMDHTARLTLRHAAWWADRDILEALPAMNMAKFVCNKNAIDIASTAMQVCGGQGYLRRFPLERHFRDSRAGAVMGANLEVLRDMVGKSALGLDPRQQD
uniref:Butyryl-CoA dehydrogenase n=1 Tax=uncultured Acidobacteria bacterium A3 TaxID=1036853 RepID=F8TTH2_9BACT|nr:butyryl-CoA dehydrogenase [uncultured Acidobacteria bacterium A3]